MKQWTRAGLAILLAILAVSYIGMIPAQAVTRDARTETVITYRGYTLSWTKPDASDLRIVRTPGRAEHLPDSVSERSIQNAKSRVSNATKQLSEDPTDSCNFVPDSFGAANFTSACDAHDACYSNQIGISRLDCDRAFLANLTSACNQAYATQPGLMLTCFTVASIYFVGVRLFGASFYTGSGSPA